MLITPETESVKRSTLDDVARLAGVAPITVSRVVKDQSASRETRERVLRAIAELRYQPTARPYKRRKVLRLGLLFLREGGTQARQLVAAVLAHAGNDRLHIALAPSRTLREASAQAQRLVDEGVDGFILPYPLCGRAQLVRQIERARCAMVALSSGEKHLRLSSVGINESGAAFAMTCHLIELGHRRIGFIQGDPAHPTSLERLAGYRCALEAHHIAYDEALVARSASTYRSGLDAARWLIDRASRPTAIFAGDDETAVAAMTVAGRAGIEIPRDLTVAGFGDTPRASAIWPALTTVRVPTALMLERAIQILARQVRHLRADTPCEREQAIVDVAVIRRQSDAAPRARPPAA